jgi:ketosteroid isomerase-like protein
LPIVPAEPTNIELARRGFDAWNADDLDALLALCHPEIEYHSSGVFPGMEPVYRGKEGIRRWWQTFHEPWSEIKVIPEKIVERPGVVNVLVRFEGTGRQGIETSMRFINALEIRDGLLRRFNARAPSEEAIRELGLD